MHAPLKNAFLHALIEHLGAAQTDNPIDQVSRRLPGHHRGRAQPGNHQDKAPETDQQPRQDSNI
jgi:hypothetical protein